MNSRKTTQEIELEAAEWLRRQDFEDWTEGDQVQLTAWLDVDTHNRVAYLRLQAAWNEMNRLRAVGAGHPRGIVPPPDPLDDERVDPGFERSPLSARFRFRSAAVVGLAASVVLAVGFALYIASSRFSGTKYSTQTGAVTTVALRDGSNVTLSTDSEIRVRLKPDERLIELAQGEAFFEVAHDATRPFVVHAGNKRIIAVGTQFSVRREEDGIRVVVTEGKVRLEEEGRGARPDTLVAGTVATSRQSRTRIETVGTVEAEDQVSWRQGFVVFHETALAEAVAEFNRYNDRKIIIENPTVASMKLSGKFRATNIDSFVSLLEQTYGIHTTRDGSRIVINTE